MREAQIGLPHQPKHVSSYRLFSSFLRLSSGLVPSQNGGSGVAVTVRGYTEEKMNTCADRRRPTYYSRPQIIQDNLDLRIRAQHNRARRDGEDTGISRMGRGHWVTHICNNRSKLGLNFELKTDKAVVTQCPVSFEFSTLRVLPHCWQNKGLSRSKNKHRLMAISEAIDGWRMWKESVTY